MEKDKTKKEPQLADLVFSDEESGEKLSVFLDSKIKEESVEKTLVLDDQKIEEISTMHAVGLRREDIAKILKISPKNFKKLVDKVDSLQKALHAGRAHAKGQVSKSLYQRLMDKDANIQAYFQWLFMFGGEKNPNRLSLTDKAGEPMPVEKLPPEDRVKAILHHNELLISGGVLSHKNKVDVSKENKDAFEKLQNDRRIIDEALSEKEE